MPPPSAKPGLTLAGVVVGFVGFLVAAYAWTGERAYDLTFLYVALAGSVLMVGGVGVAGYGRAIGQGGRRRRSPKAKAAKPAAESKPAPAKGKRKLALPKLRRSGDAPELEAEKGELWPASLRQKEAEAPAPARSAQAEAQDASEKPKRRRFKLPRPGKSGKSAGVPLSELEDETGELWPTSLRPGELGEDAQRFELRCPECSVRFPAEGTPPLEVRCPGCGVAGTIG